MSMTAAGHAIPNAYATLEQMLAQEKLDLAVIATPDHLHAGAVEALINARLPSFQPSRSFH